MLISEYVDVWWDLLSNHSRNSKVCSKKFLFQILSYIWGAVSILSWYIYIVVENLVNIMIELEFLLFCFFIFHMLVKIPFAWMNLLYDVV